LCLKTYLAIGKKRGGEGGGEKNRTEKRKKKGALCRLTASVRRLRMTREGGKEREKEGGGGREKGLEEREVLLAARRVLTAMGIRYQEKKSK